LGLRFGFSLEVGRWRLDVLLIAPPAQVVKLHANPTMQFNKPFILSPFSGQRQNISPVQQFDRTLRKTHRAQSFPLSRHWGEGKGEGFVLTEYLRLVLIHPSLRRATIFVFCCLVWRVCAAGA